MTELRLEPYAIPAADLGPENPLPSFREEKEDGVCKLDASVPEEDRRFLGWRTAHRVLPYRLQDGYTRRRQPRPFSAVVLENEILRATVLPELGGRLVSLIHKPAQRELLERNPVFQPANLALRSAWFSGGIEWNVSHPGHHYLTCSPVFAARVRGSRGEPVLRLYEWDRVKCFPWQVDVHLPPGSPFLFARVRVVNPHDRELPMYWWTNVAVTESPGWRTLVPAENTLYHNPAGIHAVAPLPRLLGTDITYGAQVPFANSFFFRIPDGHRPWIAVLDERGAGFVHASTAGLRGRKMFCWGATPGGRRWQEYLALPGHAYLEIQAGLARTQMECVPMPARAVWCWTEAFGLLEADAGRVHSADWGQAWRAAEAALDARLPQSQLEAMDRELSPVTSRSPEAILARGSGWAALERQRCSRQGEEDRIPSELVFDDSSLGPDQAPWLTLLESGLLPEGHPVDDPGQWMVQAEWEHLLRRGLKLGRPDHWLTWLHLGNMRLEALDRAGAREGWQRSLERRPSAWALRNLSVLEGREGRKDAAADLLRQAWDLGPKISPLALEYARALFQNEQYESVRLFITGLPEDIRRHERLQILSANAALKLGDLEEVEGLFARELASIREGEVPLTDLWFALHEHRIAAAEKVPIDAQLRRRVRKECPPPASIDFRVHPDAG